MSLKLSNFELVATSDPAITWATFDIEFDDGTLMRAVSLIDDGTYIRLSGAEIPDRVRDDIIGVAMEEIVRRLR